MRVDQLRPPIHLARDKVDEALDTRREVLQVRNRRNHVWQLVEPLECAAALTVGQDEAHGVGRIGGGKAQNERAQKM